MKWSLARAKTASQASGCVSKAACERPRESSARACPAEYESKAEPESKACSGRKLGAEAERISRGLASLRKIMNDSGGRSGGRPLCVLGRPGRSLRARQRQRGPRLE